MVKVTRAEVDILRQKAPTAHIAIVNRGHRNKGYFVEESREAKKVLGELRGTWVERSRSNNRNNRRSRRPRKN